MRAMSVSFPGPRAFSPTFDTQNRPGVTVLARGDDPPDPPLAYGHAGPEGRPPGPPAGLRPGSSVTGPGPCWPGGATPWNPPVAEAPATPLRGPRPCWSGKAIPERASGRVRAQQPERGFAVRAAGRQPRQLRSQPLGGHPAEIARRAADRRF